MQAPADRGARRPEVALIFPPATDPRAPHLAIPALLAALRRSGHDALVIDADIGGLEYLASAPRVEQALHELRHAAPRPADELGRDALSRLLARGEALVEDIDAALAALRDPTAFYDPIRLNWARNALYDSLDLHCAAAPRPVQYGLYPIRYGVGNVDPQKLSALLDVTGDPAANLFRDYFAEHVYARIDAATPAVVGVSILNAQQLIPGLTLARELKARGHFVVIGGTLLTKFVGVLQRRPRFFETFCDALVVYEGDTALVRLLEARLAGTSLGEVPNLLYPERGEIRSTPIRVEDVAALPTPDFAGMPLDRYLAPEPVLPILLGKGCYFNRCKFCDIPYINHVSKKAYRLRGAETVAADMRDLADRFGTRSFLLTDEALPPRLLDGLVREIADDGFSLVGYARLERGFTPDLCQRLADGGLRKLFFGLESASQVMLDHMDKGVDIADAPAILRNCRDAGIAFHLFSMVGLPTETEAMARETLQFFLDNGDTIDAPGNSFDVHDFGLELRTGYFEQHRSDGIVISPSSLAKDFVLGVDGDAWDATVGMTRARARELVSEFWSTLRRRFRRFHNAPLHMFPMWEEYAVLYAEHYRTRTYRHPTTLPTDDSGEAVAMSWAPDVVRQPVADGVRVLSRNGRVLVQSQVDAALATPSFAPVQTAVRRIGTLMSPRAGTRLSDAVVRQTVDRLVLAGLMVMQTRPLDAAPATGAEVP